jgi:electron transport complex protein RnfC
MATGLKTFIGGVHPPDMKRLSNVLAIEELPAPPLVRIPMSQHLGAPCQPAVKAGDEVKKGQAVGTAAGFVSAPVHSPVSGKVKEVKLYPHIFGAPINSVVIENNGKEEWAEGLNVTEADISALGVDELKKRIQDAGIVGMGGATFPLHVKLSPPKEKPIDTFILNGVECEPYLTADHRLMLEDPDGVLEGGRILAKILGAKNLYIGIEANKPDAIELMKSKASAYGFTVAPLYVKYPQGAEKQLIYAITGRQVPSGGLPMDVACVVNNVGTAQAAYQAVKFRRPLIERVLTITGDGVTKPGNFRARIGTPLAALLEKAGVKETANKLILGGPMMGLAQPTDDIVVIKGTSGILVLDAVEPEPGGACIRCARCVGACPMWLNPGQISVVLEAGNVDEALQKNVLDCIECGACTYICPAKRPIVHYVKFGKSELAKRKKK